MPTILMPVLFILTVLLAAAFIFAVWKVQQEKKQNAALQEKLTEKRIDDGTWQNSFNSLHECRRLLETQQAKLMAEMAAIRANIEKKQATIAEAQKQCRLEADLSDEDFGEWLRKLETAQQYAVKEAGLEQIFAPLKVKITAFESAFQNYCQRVDSTDSKSLMRQNLSNKLEFIRSFWGDLHNRQIALQAWQKADTALKAEKDAAKARFAQARAAEEAAETAWQQKITVLFEGKIAPALLIDNLEILRQFCETDREAARLYIALTGQAQTLLQKRQKLVNAAIITVSTETEEWGNEAFSLSDLEAKNIELQKRAELAAGDYKHAITAVADAKNALDSIGCGDDLAVFTQQKENLAVECQAVLETYAKQIFGIMLADKALVCYREKHRGPMLEDSSRAFAALTDKAYPRLEARIDGDKELLWAEDSQGRLKEISALSKGTLFQLYLALRAAAYEDLLKRGINLPFFCDDIFETFDDDRTRTACSLMQHIGRKGQAIYLTHHHHVVDIAKKVCNADVKIHMIN